MFKKPSEKNEKNEKNEILSSKKNEKIEKKELLLLEAEKIAIEGLKEGIKNIYKITVNAINNNNP